MNSDCLACSIAAKQIKMDTLYEDDTVIAVLDTKGANIGQMLLFPKRHVPIIEQLSAEEWKRMGIVGNALSVALFEALAPKGTNMFVANGVAAGQTVAHVMMYIIPRQEKDDVGLTWNGKALSEQQLSSVELKIKESMEEKKEDLPKPPPIRQLPTDSVSLIQKQLFRRP